MTNIYVEKQLKSQNYFQRLFKIKLTENAIVEINNLFATKSLREIKIDEISKIEIKYKIDLRKKFLEILKEFYERYLRKCLEDNLISGEELDDLTYLRQLLALQEKEVIEMHNHLGGEIYKNAFEKIISDGKIEKSDKEYIYQLQQNLLLPDVVTNEISENCRKSFVNSVFKKISADEKISPHNWNYLNQIANNLNVNIYNSTTTNAIIERMKLNWLIENGELPVKQVGINLQKNEQCFYSAYIDWLELRKITKRVNYSGPTYRIKIAKGFHYRVGSVKPQRITSEELQEIDRGMVYITSKRIIFTGSIKNTNIPLSKILSITPYSDGVGIEKDSGKSPILRVSNDADLLAMYLARVINDFCNGSEHAKSKYEKNIIPLSNNNQSENEDGEFIRLIKAKKLLEATKYYKEKSNVSLVEAKKRVDEIYAALKSMKLIND